MLNLDIAAEVRMHLQLSWMAAILSAAALPAAKSFSEAPPRLLVEVAREKQYPARLMVVQQLEAASLSVVVH